MYSQTVNWIWIRIAAVVAGRPEIMSHSREMTPRQRHRAQRLRMLFASLALTAVLLLALSLLLNQRATALTSAIPNPTLAAPLDAPVADSVLSASG